MGYMTRRKHPFETVLFSKIYANAYTEPCSGYQLSKMIYGYTTKSYYILEKIREHPDYFKEITHKTWSEPRYQSESQPLVDYIFQHLSLKDKDRKYIAHQKKLLKEFIESNHFREMLKKSRFAKTTFDIITLVSLQFVGLKFYKQVFIHKIDEIKKQGITLQSIDPFMTKIEQRYRTTRKDLSKDLHYTDLINMAGILQTTYFSLSDELIERIIHFTPYSHYVYDIADSMIAINDVLWELKTGQF